MCRSQRTIETIPNTTNNYRTANLKSSYHDKPIKSRAPLPCKPNRHLARQSRTKIETTQSSIKSWIACKVIQCLDETISLSSSDLPSCVRFTFRILRRRLRHLDYRIRGIVRSIRRVRRLIITLWIEMRSLRMASVVRMTRGTSIIRQMLISRF